MLEMTATLHQNIAHVIRSLETSCMSLVESETPAPEGLKLCVLVQTL